jgi:tetratricopeptide (TPR) repeat protein
MPILRAALAYLLDGGDRALALGLATALHRLWDYRGYMSEGRAWLHKALADRSDATLEAQAKALNAAGWLAYRESDLAQTQRFHEEALFLAEQAEDEMGIVDTCQNLAVIEMDRGDYVIAQERLEQCLNLARSLDYHHGIARTLARLGSLAWDQDRITESLAYRQASLRIEQQLGNQVNMATRSWALGMLNASWTMSNPRSRIMKNRSN